MNIYEVCEELAGKYHGVLLSGINSAPAGDIDIYIPKEQQVEAASFLDTLGFVLVGESSGQSIFSRFESGGELYILDLYASFESYFQGRRGKARLSAIGNSRLAASAGLNKSFKYLVGGRLDKGEYLRAHATELLGFFGDQNNFEYLDSEVVAARKISVEELSGVFKLGAFEGFLARLVYLMPRLFSGKSIAFVGPDGSGKSFYIQRLERIGNTKTQYLGDWFFFFQRFYNSLMRLPSPWNRVVYIFYPIENFFRLVRVYFWRVLGRDVLIDRFPGTNRNVLQGGFLKRLNDVTYRIFPKPGLLVVLTAPPEEVYKRKQELSIESIRQIQKGLALLVRSSRHIELDTTDPDRALNTLLFYLRGAS